MGSVYIYHLVDPEALASRADLLAAKLFDLRRSEDTLRFRISPVSGGLSYLDLTRLGRNANPLLLPSDATAAERAARDALLRLKNRIAEHNHRSRPRDQLPTLIPTELRVLTVRPVFAPGSTIADHWLARFGVCLPSGLVEPDVSATPPLSSDTGVEADAPVPSRPIPSGVSTIARSATTASALVEGAIIEIRIGARGTMLGLWSRWRPYDRYEPVRLVAPTAERPLADPDARAFLFYRMAPEEHPQTFIAPYYVMISKAGRAIVPASTYSLVVQIEQEKSVSGMRLRASVAGSLGSIRFAWGAWQLDGAEPMGKLTYLGASHSVDLSPGIYNVILDVVDRRTRAIARAQRMAYVGGEAASMPKRGLTV